jgi:hypothetical protein
MAKVFSTPENIQCPGFQWNDQAKYSADVSAFKESLKTFCKDNSKCPDAGEIIRFQIADGYAQYMVFKYTELFHIEEGDAYQIPEAHSRGLRKADIIQKIKAGKAMEKLFASQK